MKHFVKQTGCLRETDLTNTDPGSSRSANDGVAEGGLATTRCSDQHYHQLLPLLFHFQTHDKHQKVKISKGVRTQKPSNISNEKKLGDSTRELLITSCFRTVVNLHVHHDGNLCNETSQQKSQSKQLPVRRSNSVLVKDYWAGPNLGPT